MGAAYDADPLVRHGPFRRGTVSALLRCMDAIESGPGLGDLPTLYAHGERDELVPMANALPAARSVRGARGEERVYPGAKHEIFNETNKAEVIADVLAFIDRALATPAH